MSCEKTEFYCHVGPPKSQPRKLDFEKLRGEKVSERKGRGGKISIDSLENLTLSSKTSNNDSDQTTDSDRQWMPNDSAEHEGGQDIILNQTLLKEYNVNLDEHASVKAGDVLTVARPFVSVLATSCRGKRCENCFLEKPVKVYCDRCKYANYCSDKCLDEDKHIHEAECYYIGRRRAGGPSGDTTRMILRIILMMRSPMCKRICDIVPGRTELRYFPDLVDHFDDIINAPNRFDMVNAYYDQIIQIMGESDAPDPNYFLECYGRMAINSFNILDDNDDAVGTALYLGPSIMNHSCKPNASVRFENQKHIVVRALEDMECRDFSQIFISYIDVMETTKRRQDHLLKNYYFLCQCPRCLDVDFEKCLSCIQCAICCKEGSQVFIGRSELSVKVQIDDSTSIEIEPCTDCKGIQNSKVMEDYMEVYEVIRTQHDQTEFPFDLAKFSLTLMKRTPVFGKFHILNIKVSECALDGYLSEITDCEKRLRENTRNGASNKGKENEKEIGTLLPKELLEEALSVGLFLVEAHKKFRMHLWAKLAYYMAQVAEIEHKLGLIEDARAHAISANEILCIAKGNIRNLGILEELF